MKDYSEIDLTEEEKTTVARSMDAFKGKWFPEDKIGDIQALSASGALELLAFDKIENRGSDYDIEKELQTASGLRKELQALSDATRIMKNSYLIYPIPPRLCFLADFVYMAEMLNQKDHNISSNLYKDFIKQTEEYVPNDVSEIALKTYNQQEMLKQAKERSALVVES